MGDALRTTSIEAAAKVLAPTASNWAAYLPDAERVVDAVLGVAVPSTRRDALDEAIAAVEGLLRHKVPGAAGRYGGEDLWLVSYDEALARLRGLRDTQAPT